MTSTFDALFANGEIELGRVFGEAFTFLPKASPLVAGRIDVNAAPVNDPTRSAIGFTASFSSDVKVGAPRAGAPANHHPIAGSPALVEALASELFPPPRVGDHLRREADGSLWLVNREIEAADGHILISVTATV